MFSWNSPIDFYFLIAQPDWSDVLCIVFYDYLQSRYSKCSFDPFSIYSADGTIREVDSIERPFVVSALKCKNAWIQFQDDSMSFKSRKTTELIFLGWYILN